MSYPWTKDSQYLPSPVTGYLAITSPNGLDMNSKDITNVVNINGSSYPPLVSTPTLAQVLVSGNSANDSSINMNNNNISNIGQVSAQSALLTNSTSNTTLTVQSTAPNATLLTKFYNQRTAVNGEAITLDFKAKNGGIGGGAEINYAKIHMDCISTNVNDERGSLKFDVVNTAVVPGVTTYFSCDGNAQQVNSFKPLNMNTNGISNITDATTYSGSFLAPQKVDMLTANGLVPSTNLDLNMRYIACNTGADATWVDSGIANFNGSIENVTASYPSFGPYWWVGTENGNLWRSQDAGSTWRLFDNFGGRINCIVGYKGNNLLAIGGNFTGTYNYLAVIDLGDNFNDITNGYNGLNAEVKCVFENLNSKCLYIGGSFTDFNGNPGNITNAFYTYDYANSNWYSFDNSYGGGFLNISGGVGTVNSICKDNGGQGYYIIGGDFYTVSTNSGSQGISYLFTFEPYSNGYQISRFFSIGSPLNAPVNALLDFQGNGILVGGDFTSVYSVTSSSYFDYGISIVWNYNSNMWDINPYPFSGSGPISSITQPAVNSGINDVYTIYGGNVIYKNNTSLPPIPVSNVWYCIAWNGTSILYATDAQTSVGFNFYVLNAPTAIDLTSVHPIKQYSTISYNNIKLLAEGSTIELIWNVAKSQWYILSYQGASFS